MKLNSTLLKMALVTGAIGVSLSSVSLAYADGSKIYPLSPSYIEECGSCHAAFPPALMTAESWKALLGGLNKHFGEDASLAPDKVAEIGRFLDANAARRDKYRAVDVQGKPLIRVTESAWFRREHRDGHDGITAGVWRLPSVKTPANCPACHRSAEKGDYSEGGIRIPRS